MAQEWQELEGDTMVARKAELTKLIGEIVPYLMEHNTEAEACDLLMEVEKIGDLEQYVDENAYQRVCLYLKRLESTTTFIYIPSVVLIMNSFQLC